jgi:hypothetical protein
VARVSLISTFKSHPIKIRIKVFIGNTSQRPQISNMDMNWQTLLARLVVTMAAVWIFRYAWRQYKGTGKSSCGTGGCGCSGKKLTYKVPAKAGVKSS